MREEEKFFLNVKKSITDKIWVDRLNSEMARNAKTIAQTSNLSEIVGRILAARMVKPHEAEIFLTPTIRDLMPDPSSITDLDNLVAYLASAIINKEKIALFGDYDVDGACSVALMERYLRHFNMDVITHIPDRIFEGYGPNKAAIDNFVKQGVKLIISLDCGTTSSDVIKYAKNLGADFLVIDHHLSDGDLPPADAIANPNRLDDISSLGYLSAAGVCFMVLVGLNRYLRMKGETNLPDLMRFIDLVALATICDIVPLKGLNRAFVQRGIELMRNGTNIGIRALSLAARIGGAINPYHLAFLIGPRINAGGRIGDASLGARLLALDNEDEATKIAAQLNQLNIERQHIENEALKEAVEAANAEIGSGEGPSILVLASENWHPGIVGLLASRLRERFFRPAFAISIAKNDKALGSARSIAGVDLGSAVIKAVQAGIIEKGGGHAMAAGISLTRSQIGEFRKFIIEQLASQVEAATRSEYIKIDAAITARAANIDFIKQIERAGPFGAGNPPPIFAFPAHRVRFAKIVGEGRHVRFSLYCGDGAKIDAIAFQSADNELGQAILAAQNNRAIHIVGSLDINHWNGREIVQLRAIDAAWG